MSSDDQHAAHSTDEHPPAPAATRGVEAADFFWGAWVAALAPVLLWRLIGAGEAHAEAWFLGWVTWTVACLVATPFAGLKVLATPPEVVPSPTRYGTVIILQAAVAGATAAVAFGGKPMELQPWSLPAMLLVIALWLAAIGVVLSLTLRGSPNPAAVADAAT